MPIFTTDLETTIIREIEAMGRWLSIKPLIFGGAAGFSGGSTSRPIQGQLPQSKVTFDTSEGWGSIIPTGIGVSGSSLVHNLNRIRGGHSLVSSGILQRHLASGVSKLIVEDLNGPPVIDAAKIIFSGGTVYPYELDSRVAIVAALGGSGTIDGSGAATQVAYWIDSNTIAGDTGLTYDAANDTLSVGKFIDAKQDGATGGFRAGTASDIQLFRENSSTWRTPNSFIVDGDLTAGLVKIDGGGVFLQVLGSVTGQLSWSPVTVNRTITFPDATGTVSLLSVANVFTTVQTISVNAATLPAPTTGTLLHIAQADSSVTRILLDGFAVQPQMVLRRANTTAAAPSALALDNVIGSWGVIGYHSGPGYSGVMARLDMLASEAWTSTAQGTYIALYTTPTGSTTISERVRISNVGYVGIGTDSPQVRLHAVVNDSATATATEILRLGHNSTGTPAQSFGANFRITLESASAADQSAFLIGVAWLDASTPKSQVQFYVYDTAAREALRFEATGTNAKVIFPSTGQVLFGTSGFSSPFDASEIQIYNKAPIIIIAETQDAGLTYIAVSNNVGDNPYIAGWRARGTVYTSPSATQSGDFLFRMTGRGYGATAWNVASRARIDFVANQNFTDTAHGTYMSFWTTPDGSTTIAEAVRIDGLGNVGIGVTSFGTSAAKVVGIKIGTVPGSSPADIIQVYAKDSSVGSVNATLAVRTEQGVETIGTFTPSHKIRVWINEVEYWIQLDAV